MSNRLQILSITCFLVVIATCVSGQGIITTSDYIRDYSRLLEIKGESVNNPINFTKSQLSIWQQENSDSTDLGIWEDQLKWYSDEERDGLNFYLLSPRLDYTFNSEYSRSYNDGPFWSGKGSTIGLNAGVKAKWGPFTGVLYPNFYHAQNQHFQRQSPGQTNLSPRQNDLNYQLSSQIDWVQIFGFTPFSEFDWGQSYISGVFGPVELRFGTENIWWGPSVFNPILMSNTGPGFPHLDLGTSKPIVTKFGDFEYKMFWGQLGESEYFDRPSSSRRYLTGLSFSYRPSFFEFMKGFSIGVGKVLQQNWPGNGLSFKDVFLAFGNTDPTATMTATGGFVNDDTDQYLSVDVRWFFEEAEAEIYMEWVRNDFWLDIQDLASEPEHGSVFTVGMQKAFTIDDVKWRFGFENTSLATTRTREVRASGDIYTHSIVVQGWTNRGHLLGAPIGPGSKSQLIRLDRFDKNGKYGFTLNRIRFNDNYFFRRFDDFTRHDVEWNFGLEAVRFFKQFEFSGRFIYSRRMNWHYYHNLDVNNFQILTSVRYHITGKPILTLFDK